jgi:6-pyruvoyl-tetrahydropterin synthase related domain
MRYAGLLIGALAVLGASPVAAATADLRLALTIDRRPAGSVVVTATVANAGSGAAFEPYAELWNQPARRRFADLLPESRTEIAWTFTTDTWRDTVREIAALRVRYREADGHWKDLVLASGHPANAVAVDPPRWPEPATFALRWKTAPASSGRIVWWRPFAAGIEAPNTWRAAGDLTVEGRLSPNSMITGSSFSVFAILVPDDTQIGATFTSIPVDASDRGRLWRPRGIAIGLWLIGCASLWVLASRRMASVPALAAWASIGTALVALVDPALVALTTTPAGGDYASHIVGLAYLRNHLLPSGRAFGWFPDQFAGFPLMLFYFPLPFIAASLLSASMPLTVALKVASLAGTALLPVAWWVALDWLGAPLIARGIGAAGSTLFLFGEWQSVWGGNVGSTAAGEFAYSLGFSLAWLALARAWRTRDDRHLSRTLAVFFAATALSHGYALVAAVCGVGLMTLHVRRGPARALRLLGVGCVAFGLTAWWLVPFLWNLPWTIGVAARWAVAWRDLCPPALWAPLAIVAIGVGRSVLPRTRDRMAVEGGGWFWLLAFSIAMAGLYSVGFSVGVVDIRFLPFCQAGFILLACWEVGRWIDALPHRAILPAAAAVIVAVTAASAAQMRAVPDWIRWNFNGIERTGPWPYYQDVMTLLASDNSGLRVVFEHHPDLGETGTTRVFEMIPWFSGRGTLEGLYRESAILSPAVYYVQSLLTPSPSCPIEGLECGRFGPAQSMAHLAAFGVNTIITYTDSAARALETSDAVEPRAFIGPYEVFSVKQPAALAEPVRYRPIVDDNADWRGDAYDWFRAGTDFDVPLVLGRQPRIGEPHVRRYAPRMLPREAYESDATVSAIVDGDRITLETSTPGRPVLLKVAYHPGWRAGDGSPIDMAAPGMLMVTPRSARVELRWSSGRAGALGLALTVAALILIMFLPLLSVDVHETSRRTGVVWCAALIAATATAVGFAVVRRPSTDYASLLSQGQQALARRDFPTADGFFVRVLASGDRHHALRDDAGMAYALSAEGAGSRPETEARLRRFLDEFPVSTFRSEALVRLARLLEPNHTDDERQLLDEATEAPLGDPHWKDEARRLRAELAQ